MTATLANPAPPSALHSPAVLGRARKLHTHFRIHTAPALLSALCFATGILLGHWFRFAPGILAVALTGCFCVAATANALASRLAWPSAMVLYLVLGMFSASVAAGVDPQRELGLAADGTPRRVEGEIMRLGPIRVTASASMFSNNIREERSQQMDLRLLNLDHAPAGSAEAVRVTLYAPLDDAFPVFSCGERLLGNLAMHTEERFLDPGVWNTVEYLHSQGIGALASAHVQDLSVVSSGSHGELGCRLHSLQLRASSEMSSYVDDQHIASLPVFLRLSKDDAAMLAAMLTGDRTYLHHRLRIGFERTGSFHLLVVSGLHLAIFSAVIFGLARRLHLSRGWASLLSIAGSSAYAIFTGFGYPVQRALGMVTLYLIGRLLWRDRSAFNAIGLVALVLLAVDPNALFESGMQMTLLSVIAIAGVAAPATEKTFGPYLHAMRNLSTVRLDPALPPRVAQFRVSLRMLARHLQPLTGPFLAWRAFPFSIRMVLRITEVLVVSSTIEFFMMLPMAVYFHRVTLIALPVNLLIVPLLGLLLPCSLVTFGAIILLPTCAFIPAAATAMLLHVVTRIVAIFAAVRAADWRLPEPSAGAIALWIVLCIAAICLTRLRRFALTAAMATMATAAAVIVIPRPLPYRPHQLEITAIDVGQGDSLLVVTPEGKTLLIDAGGLVGASPDSNFDIGEEVVSPVLWSRGVRRLDAVAITHAHTDHIGGMPAVLENFRPGVLWVGKNPAVPSYQRILSMAAQVGTRTENHIAGDTFAFGGTSIQVLAPARDYRPGATPLNNDSLVLRVVYGGTSALLEGDAEAPSETRMVAAGDLRSDLLKVGHHGSITSTTPAFLAAVSPAYSVISVGRRNFYGHPRREVLRELQSAHVRTFLTDMTGLTSFYLDGTRVSTENWAAAGH